MSSASKSADASSQQVSKTFTVANKMGIHARPAAMIVRTANKYDSAEVLVEKDGEQVNGKSIMGLMMLAAGNGSKVKVTVAGQGAEQALEEFEQLFLKRFDEA
jgi:phosphocarrier protein